MLRLAAACDNTGLPAPKPGMTVAEGGVGPAEALLPLGGAAGHSLAEAVSPEQVDG